MFRKIVDIIDDRNLLNFLPDSFYLKLRYYVETGKKLNLKNPSTYDEKLQWLKLYDRNENYSNLVDKASVKNIVKKKIGKEYVIPTLQICDKFEQIDFDKLPNSFVIKCTHDSGGLIVCKNKKDLDISFVKNKINKCLKKNYYKYRREWPYKNIKPRIIIEKFISGLDGSNMLDYKFMCFNGKVEYLFLDVGVIDNQSGGHAHEYYRNIYSKEFELLDVIETRSNTPYEIKKPKNYDKMVSIAEKLSAGLKHVRVDLYNVDGKIYFGEMTFYHGSGYNNFFPKEYEKILGDLIHIETRK